MTPQKNYKHHLITGKRKEVTRTRTTLCSTGKKPESEEDKANIGATKETTPFLQFHKETHPTGI
ncbi:unnamed protein product [Brassica napus]|uniref:(rape) hypothetical protein n=1 Tax=Brassica napus TaxID=3708 RepID=A0A816IDN9_BRANA|nr:unnamed protein product [Brassica napus]